MSEDFKNTYVRTFKGSCYGIGISLRGTNDPHVVFTLLFEDDEHWWDEPTHPIIFSSFWKDDIPHVIELANRWCENSCDIDEKDGINWGWKFRSKHVR
jgi:hypothetical protein